MKPRTNGVPRSQNKNFQGQGPNWVLIAGGALLSTLSVRLGYKLKQALDSKQVDGASCNSLKGNGKSSEKKRSGACTLHTNMFSFSPDEDGCYNCHSGISDGMVDVKRPPTGLKEADDPSLHLVAIPAPGSNRENGVMWASSPDRLELPRKPFHHSNSSDSPCVSESGSDIYTKREVIHKLRQQLKRRDDMIMEMQDQMMELQSSLNAQRTHSAVLQSQLDEANRDLFDSEREIQRLRKAIADHCVRDTGHSAGRNWQAEGRNGYENGFSNGDIDLDNVDKGRGDGDRIEMLKREVDELKEVIEGKEYLLQSYKEQKTELFSKVSELQHRLASQELPKIPSPSSNL